MSKQRQQGRTSSGGDALKEGIKKRGVPKGVRNEAEVTCTAVKKDGTTCGNNAVAGTERCVEHLEGHTALPAAINGSLGIPRKDRRPAPPIPASTRSLVPDDMWEEFQRLWTTLYEDFDLNHSSDYVSVEFVCLSHIQAKQARANGDADALKIHETIIRSHMNALKATRISRESANVNVTHNVSPADWAAALLVEGEKLGRKKREKLEAKKDKRGKEPFSVDAEWSEVGSE